MTSDFTLFDLMTWADLGGEPPVARAQVRHLKYERWKGAQGRAQMQSLDDMPEEIAPLVRSYADAFDGLVLTGSWFLGTYVDASAPAWVGLHRKGLHKPPQSDVDFWDRTGRLKRDDVVRFQDERKVDLIYGWWGWGIDIRTGEILRCDVRSREVA